MEELQGLTFLRYVWGKQQGYVDLPIKREDGSWQSNMFSWPDQQRSISMWLDDCRDVDTYFSVCVFSEGRRRAELALPNDWLWADLDEVTPSECVEKGVGPTVCWETSLGRYQALWRVDRVDRVEGGSSSGRGGKGDSTNRDLSILLGADPGGWDITQVLRVPGTFNWKESAKGEDGSPWRVRVVFQGKALDVGKIGAVVGAGVELPTRVKALLRMGEQAGGVVVGERSSRLWEMECLLAEAGFDREAIYKIVVESGWNKWKDKGGVGERRLRADIDKALAKINGSGRVLSVSERGRVGRVGEGRDNGIAGRTDGRLGIDAFTDYGKFLGSNLEAPRWLIQDVWTAGSHGIIGGEPKTAKSTLALALGLSVASGSPFLGESSFPVHQYGPVLIVQEENAPWVMQDRLRKIARLYGLIKGKTYRVKGDEFAVDRRTEIIEFPRDVPLWILNNHGFDMTTEGDRELLEAAVKSVGAKLVVLDPLYLMIGSNDADRMSDLKPLLQWLLYLRFTYDCAIVVVHHFRKRGTNEDTRGRSGQRLLGSTTLHGWVESALYCERLDTGEVDGQVDVKIEREFRNIGVKSPIDLTMKMGLPGDLDFWAKLNTIQDKRDSLFMALLKTKNRSMTLKHAADELGVDKRTVLKWVKKWQEEDECPVLLREKPWGSGTAWEMFLPPKGGSK